MDDQRNLPLITEAIEDVEVSTLRYIFKHRLWQAVGIVAGSLFLTLALLFLIGMLEIDPDNDSGAMVFLPLAIPFGFYAAARYKIQTWFIRQYASANHFEFQGGGSLTNELGVLFLRGRKKKIYNIVHGKFLSFPLRFFNYDYTIGSGRGSETFHYSVFELRHEGNLPRIYFDVHFGKRGKTPSWRIKNMQRLSFELPEFNRRFSVYAEKGQATAAFQLFSPDIMWKLLHASQLYDAEFIDGQLFIYADGIIRSKKRMQELHEFARYLVEALERTLQKMRG